MKTNAIGQSLECPQTFDMEFARKLIVHLGGDATPVEDDWCWNDFIELPDFDRLLPLMMDYFENATTGNPSLAAYQLHIDYDDDVPLDWAQRVVEKDMTGNPSWFAYKLHMFDGAPLDWAQRVIENATTGDPSWAAYWLHRNCDAPLDWAQRVVEKDTTGDSLLAAYMLHKHCDAPLDWAQRIVENATTGDPSWFAYLLHKKCGAPLDWMQCVQARYAMKANAIGPGLECPKIFDIEFARRLIVHLGGDATPVEDDWCWEDFRQLPDFDRLLPLAMDYFEHATTGDPSWAAYFLHRYCGAPLDWAQRVVENATTGESSWIAYVLHEKCGASLDWAQQIVENATSGDPSTAAEWLHTECGAPLDWVKQVQARSRNES